MEVKLGKRMEELSHRHPSYGYRRIAALLRREGWRAGKRLVQWLRRALRLAGPTCKAQAVRRATRPDCRHERSTALACPRSLNQLL